VNDLPSRPQVLQRRARAVAIIATLSIWLIAVAVALRTNVSQIIIGAIALLGLAPYLISLHLIEPRLGRGATKQGNHP
jgi:hypothetical protein